MKCLLLSVFFIANFLAFASAKDWSCFNKTACTDFFCSNDDAAHRAGNLCYDFPYYNGGYPIGGIGWDNGQNVYTCTKDSSNYEYCDTWQVNENSGSKVTTGNCFCQQPSLNQKYCDTWRCLAIDVYKCASTEYVSGQSCCSKSSSTGKTTCHPISVSTEYTDCICLTNSTNQEYCNNWQCSAAITGQSGFQVENYTCTQPSKDEKICSNWKGYYDSTSSFGFALCNCFATSVNGTFCKQWTCNEKELKYRYANLAWSALSVLAGGMGLITIDLMIYIMPKMAILNISFVILSVLWMCGFLFLGIFLGGFWVFIITVSIWFPIMFITDLVVLCIKAKRSIIGRIFGGLFSCCEAIDCSDVEIEWPSCSCPCFSRSDEDDVPPPMVEMSSPNRKANEAETEPTKLQEVEEEMEPPSYNEAVQGGA